MVAEASRLVSGYLCRVHKRQTAAWASASSATASHAADWKAAHEVICALDKTTSCTVPTCPTVTKPTVATGVETADTQHCTAAPTKAPTKAPTNVPTGTPTRCRTEQPECTGYRTLDYNSNSCAGGYTSVNNEAACRTAAAAFVGVFQSTGSWATDPAGCQINKAKDALWFNTNAGTANSGYSPVCIPYVAPHPAAAHPWAGRCCTWGVNGTCGNCPSGHHSDHHSCRFTGEIYA